MIKVFLQQVSVFIENRQGRLDEVIGLLGDNGIDLSALSVADTENFGILRVIVSAPERAVEVLRANGYTANLTAVMALAVPDSPGGLAGVLRLIKEAGIFIEYMYSLVRRVGDAAVLVLRVDDTDKALALFEAEGIKMIGPNEVANG